MTEEWKDESLARYGNERCIIDACPGENDASDFLCSLILECDRVDLELVRKWTLET